MPTIELGLRVLIGLGVHTLDPFKLVCWYLVSK